MLRIVARALENKAFVLERLGRSEETPAVFDEFVGRFGDGDLAAAPERVASALVRKAAALSRLQLSDDQSEVHEARARGCLRAVRR